MSTITSRIDNVARIGERYRKEVLPAPPSLKIEISSRCNYKCTFCDHGSKPVQQDMDRALFSRVIREARTAGVEELGVFLIGESFLCRWLPDAIREAKEVGFPYVFLTTNGSMATPQKVRQCMDAGLDSLKFSINAASEEQFASIMNVSPRLFYQALANVQSAREIRDAGGYLCRLYASSIAFDGEQGERMRDLVEREVRPWVDEHYWLPLFSWSGDRTSAEEDAGMAPIVGNVGRRDAPVPPLPCWAVFKEAHVTHDGKLSACCFATSPRFDMADLSKTGFMDGWNGEAFQSLRRAHLGGDVRGTACEACIARQ